MKTKTIKSLVTPFALCATFIFSACQDEAEKPSVVNPEKQESVEKVLALREDLNFINRFVDENSLDFSLEGGRRSVTKNAIARITNSAPCTDATEEELPDGSIRTTLDFGDGCQTEDGIEVAGKVVMIFGLDETTFGYSLEFIDYSEADGEHAGEVVNGTVEGSFVFDLETSEFTQEMEQDLTITYADNTEAGYKMAQRAEMTDKGLRVASLETRGNFADGGAFAMTVSKALVYDFSCESDYPIEGEETLTFQGNTIRVNYGNGTCDNKYTLK